MSFSQFFKSKKTEPNPPLYYIKAHLAVGNNEVVMSASEISRDDFIRKAVQRKHAQHERHGDIDVLSIPVLSGIKGLDNLAVRETIFFLGYDAYQLYHFAKDYVYKKEPGHFGYARWDLDQFAFFERGYQIGELKARQAVLDHSDSENALEAL
jgi:hypothetical protein